MMKMYCNVCNRYRKSKNPKISYIFLKSFDLFIVYSYIIMSEKNISQEFILKNIDETKNYFINELIQNELMSKKYKKVYRDLNYIEHLL